MGEVFGGSLSHHFDNPLNVLSVHDQLGTSVEVLMQVFNSDVFIVEVRGGSDTPSDQLIISPMLEASSLISGVFLLLTEESPS